MAKPRTPSLLRWRHKHLSASNTNVPTSPGVYAIGHHDSFHGLELRRIYVYVGETNNLRRRLDEHLPDTEQNPGLRSYLKRNFTTAVCWFTPLDGAQVKAVQDELIEKIQPQYNTVGTSDHKGKEDTS